MCEQTINKAPPPQVPDSTKIHTSVLEGSHAETHTDRQTDRQTDSRAGRGRGSCSLEMQAHPSTWHVTKIE